MRSTYELQTSDFVELPWAGQKNIVFSYNILRFLGLVGRGKKFLPRKKFYASQSHPLVIEWKIAMENVEVVWKLKNNDTINF